MKLPATPDQVFVVLTTWPDADSARAAARTVVEEGLAACGNLVPGIESIYRWRGSLETSAEVMVILKTAAERYPALEARLRHLHPYEVPEIVALKTAEGSKSYLDWVVENSRCPHSGSH